MEEGISKKKKYFPYLFNIVKMTILSKSDLKIQYNLYEYPNEAFQRNREGYPKIYGISWDPEKNKTILKKNKTLEDLYFLISKLTTQRYSN